MRLKSSSLPPTLTIEQTQKLDSIKAILEIEKSDSIIFSLLHQIYIFYMDEVHDLSKSEQIADSILRIASKYSRQDYYFDAHYSFGSIWYDRGDYSKALISYTKAVEHLKNYHTVDHKWKSENLARLYINIAACFQLTTDIDNALEYYLKSIDQLNFCKDSLALTTVYYNIGYLYSDINNWEECYRYTKKSIDYIVKDSYIYAINISRMASVCVLLNRIEEAKSYLNLRKTYSKQTFNHLDALNYASAQGVYLKAKNEFVNAKNFLNSAYKEATIYGDPYWVAVQARELGLLYMATKNFKSADHFFHIAKDVATEFAYQPQVLQSFSDLSDLAATQGKLSEALMFRNRQITYSDSLVKKQNHNRILYYNAKFEADKKQNEIIQLQKDNEIKNLTIQQSMLWLYFSFTGTLAIVIVGLLVYFNMRHKQNFDKQKSDLQLQQIRELEKDKQLILADAILKGQEQERGRLAKDLHDGLGGLLSGVKISLSNMKASLSLPADQALSFDRSLDMLDHSIQELRRVSHNMMPESLVKFGLVAALRDFCESINTMKAAALHFQLVGERRVLDVSHETIIYRIVQELVNNALKHSGAKNIIVQLMYEADSMSVTVEDDGKGFDVESVKSTTNSGWANVQSRISYLKGKLDVTSRQGEGTSVHIFLTI